MSPRGRNVVTAISLFVLLGLVSTTSPRWARMLRRPMNSAPVDSKADAIEPITPPLTDASTAAERKINVKLFFEAVDREGLVIEERSVPFSSDLTRQIRVVVEELIKGSAQGFVNPVAAETRVLDVFVTARGVAYVDLSKEFREKHIGGSGAELLTVYAIVNSLTTSFPAVKRVQILVEDKPAATLAGHVNLSRPLPPDMTLLATFTPTPQAGTSTGSVPVVPRSSSEARRPAETHRAPVPSEGVP